MGLRFRRSVRLFPGVRVNFSRGGVSTSIGVRGAHMTVGPRGAYANIGLPGSGISYRTRLDAPVRQHDFRESFPQGHGSPRPSLHPSVRTAGVASVPGTEIEIKSADISLMTSPGLGGLKQLINEASARRAELRSELAKCRKTLREAERRLVFMQLPIIRLFSEKSIPRLVDAANDADEKCDEIQALLDGCFVEVDFSFDEATRSSYDALITAFETLKSAQRI
jgi:hypothetical protein